VRPLWPYDFKGPQVSAVNVHPPSAGGSSTQRLRALPPPELLCVPTAQGNRWCRERGFAHGDKAEPLRRAHHSGVELGVDPGHRISGLSLFAFPKVRCGRSVKSGRMSTSLSICSISIFYCFKAGRGLGGWSTHGVLSSTIIPPTTGPDLASTSTSIPILQNRPSSMKD